jgi:hypothetical protein
MYVYSYESSNPGKLIVSFHCTPVERPKVRETVVSVAMTRASDVVQLTEIQFGGSTKGHLVPEG